MNEPNLEARFIASLYLTLDGAFRGGDQIAGYLLLWGLIVLTLFFIWTSITAELSFRAIFLNFLFWACVAPVLVSLTFTIFKYLMLAGLVGFGWFIDLAQLAVAASPILYFVASKHAERSLSERLIEASRKAIA